MPHWPVYINIYIYIYMLYAMPHGMQHGYAICCIITINKDGHAGDPHFLQTNHAYKAYETYSNNIK